MNMTIHSSCDPDTEILDIYKVEMCKVLKIKGESTACGIKTHNCLVQFYCAKHRSLLI